MSLDKTRANRWVSMAILSVLGIFGLVLLLQLAAMLFGPSKSACTKQVCLAKFLEGPPAFNNEAMATYLRNNFFTPSAGGGYKLSGFTGKPEIYNDLMKYVKDYFENKRNGVFVDLGAGDGEYRSISLDLEMNLDWTGLLVEPNEELYKRLLKKGRKAQATKACISPYSYPAKLKLSYPKPKGDSEEEIIVALGKTKIDQLGEKPDNEEYHLFEAQCVPLENLIYTAGITKSIDIVVLDMAGTDLDVLLSTKLDQLPEFEMIIVRANGASIGSELGGYFLERNMVVKKVFGNAPEDAIYVLVKFDARRDL
ncbi:hypothetical protein SK128_018312 [Halocaridina rubra]|uniref:Methyltransferase FkbM domain-containing protein n=1 Tax=Halocaridina rubra TaxID=373956 RepID=A0AAN8ZW63_HALRR